MVTLYHYNFYTQYHEYARAVLADAVVLVPTGYETVVIITVVIVIIAIIKIENILILTIIITITMTMFSID